MEVEKHEFIFLKMRRDEAEKLILLLEQIDNSLSNMPDWAKSKSVELIRTIKAIGL